MNVFYAQTITVFYKDKQILYVKYILLCTYIFVSYVFL